MKLILLALFFCGASLEMLAAGTRNVIMPLDWGKELLENEFSNPNYVFQNQEYGPVTQNLIGGLHQQTAPVIVSATTWRNAIERGKIFADIVSGRDISYLQQYPMFRDQKNIVRFASELSKNYDSQNDLMRVGKTITGIEYYTAFQTFYSKNPLFKPNEWIVKKVSEYIYLLIPLKYIQSIEQSKDTPVISRQLTTALSPRERLLGMKFEHFADIPANTLLDVNANVTRMQVENYKKLVPAHAYTFVERLRKYKWEEVLRGYLFGQHITHVLPQIFVTRTDLEFPAGNKDETDINEALFLHEWLIFLNGHGSLSESGQVMPVVYDIDYGQGAIQTRSGIAYTAGLEQGAFRDYLGFFNNRVRTGSLIYTTCYSGGQHLFKLFEHQWDYPKTQKAGKGVKVTKYAVATPDTYNYLIIATNMFYSVTTSGTFLYWSDSHFYRRVPGYRLQLASYFNGMAQFLHPQVTATVKKNGNKKQKIVSKPSLQEQLATIINYVHHFDIKNSFQIPALRFPYTEWFVPLFDPGTALKLETEQDRKVREQQEAQARVLIQKALSKKVLPQKVQESIRLQELKDPALQEKARKEKEVLAQREKDLKEKELFDRMEKMRKEQEARDKAAQPKPQVPPVTTQPVKPQPVKTKPQSPVVPVPPVTVKPQPKPPVIPVPQVKPPQQTKQPLRPLPNQPNIQLPPVSGVKPPLGGVPLFPGVKLPPMPVPQPTGQGLKTPPVVQQPTPSDILKQAIKTLESSLYHVVDALLAK